jgi:hypothetical protein
VQEILKLTKSDTHCRFPPQIISDEIKEGELERTESPPRKQKKGVKKNPPAVPEQTALWMHNFIADLEWSVAWNMKLRSTLMVNQHLQEHVASIFRIEE